MGDFFDAVYNRLAENIASLTPPQNAPTPPWINGICIPQRKYDKGIPPKIPSLAAFVRQNGTYIPVKAALEGDYTGLIAHDIPAFGPEAGYTIIVRFEWPGYASHGFQMRTSDWSTPPRRITLSKLATEVSKIIWLFLEMVEVQDVAPEHQQWRVGPNGIRLEHLHLAALEQVAAGSYQPRLLWKP